MLRNIFVESVAFLVAIPEAARALDVSPRHLYNLVKARKIPAYRLSPRTTRVDVAEIRSAFKLPGNEERSEAQ